MQFSLADRDAIWASKLSWVPLCAHVPNASLLQANSRDVSRETSVRFPFLSAGWCLRAGGSRSAGGVHGHGSRPTRQARGSASVARRLAIGEGFGMRCASARDRRGMRCAPAARDRRDVCCASATSDRRGVRSRGTRRARCVQDAERGAPPPPASPRHREESAGRPFNVTCMAESDVSRETSVRFYLFATVNSISSSCSRLFFIKIAKSHCTNNIR